MSTLGQLTTGQPTVDSELMNEGCDGSDGGQYVALLEEVLAGQRRLEAKLQHLRQSNDDGFETRESRHNGRMPPLKIKLVCLHQRGGFQGGVI